MRAVADRIQSLERQTVLAGIAPVDVRGGESGLLAGRLVHVRNDGVAFLARNDMADRYCTHVVVGVRPTGELSCYGFGHWPVACVPDGRGGEAVPLWLSDVPGHGTDVEPVGAAVVQRVGERMNLRSAGGGQTYTVFKPEFWPAGKGIAGLLPPGGSEGDHLVKVSGSDYDVAWDEPYKGWNISDGTTTVVGVRYLGIQGGTVSYAGGSADAMLTITAGGGGGVESVTATPGEAGVVAGMLVHVGQDGIAWKADGTSMIRYATHVVGTVNGDGTVECVNVGTVDVLTDPDDPYDYSNTYYLSGVSKGYATPKPVAMGGAGVFNTWQMVGTGSGVRDGVSGMTRLTLQFEQGVHV